MFKFLIAIMSFVLIIACNTATTTIATKDSAINTGIEDLLVKTNFNTSQITGLYSGSFDGTPISISINYISGKNVSGYNVHKGLKRNMRGTLEPFGSQIKLMLDEPGNNRYDGHFELFIDTSSFSGKGTWKPKNDTTLKTKDFSFTKSKNGKNNNLPMRWADTLNRTIELKEDGSVLFSYYTGKGTPQEQMQNFGGNWQQKADSILIYWQPNSVFPGRRSSFFIVKEANDGDSTFYITALRGEKVEWANNEMP